MFFRAQETLEKWGKLVAFENRSLTFRGWFWFDAVWSVSARGCACAGEGYYHLFAVHRHWLMGDARDEQAQANSMGYSDP